MSNETPPTKRLSKEQWHALILEQQSSLLNQTEFCQSKGFSLATFHNWKRKLFNPKSSTQSETPQWLDLPVAMKTDTQPKWDIELELPGNVILRMRQ